MMDEYKAPPLLPLSTHIPPTPLIPTLSTPMLSVLTPMNPSLIDVKIELKIQRFITCQFIHFNFTLELNIDEIMKQSSRDTRLPEYQIDTGTKNE